MIDYNEFYLTLIRHGQSTTNQNPDLMGQTADTPLSEKGRQQAWKLGERLVQYKFDPDYVFCSTYTRAVDTAKIALQHFQNSPNIEFVPELREYSAGDWTGVSRKKVITSEVNSRMGLMGHGFLPPNGESLHQVERRVSLWFEDRILYNKEIQNESLQRKSNALPSLNIMCFSHGMTIKSFLHYVMGFDQNFTWRIIIDNTSITRLYFGENGWKLLNINDHSHLVGI